MANSLFYCFESKWRASFLKDSIMPSFCLTFFPKAMGIVLFYPSKW